MEKSLLGILLLAAALAAASRALRKERKLLYGMLPVYFLVVLYVTLFSRIPVEETRIGEPSLTKLRQYYGSLQETLSALLKNHWYVRDIFNGIVYNILLFIPLGYLLSCWRGWGYGRVLPAAFLFSLCIESAQYAFRLGWFDGEDIVTNVSGAAIGTAVYRLTMKRWARPIRKNRSEKNTGEESRARNK